MRALALIALIMPVASFAAKNTLWSEVIDAGRYVSPKGYNMQQALLRDFCARTQECKDALDYNSLIMSDYNAATDDMKHQEDKANGY